MAGKIKLDEFITHTMPLEKINEAFDLMHAGKRLVKLSNITFSSKLQLQNNLRIFVNSFQLQHPISHSVLRYVCVYLFTASITSYGSKRGTSLLLLF